MQPKCIDVDWNTHEHFSLGNQTKTNASSLFTPACWNLSLELLEWCNERLQEMNPLTNFTKSLDMLN